MGLYVFRPMRAGMAGRGLVISGVGVIGVGIFLSAISERTTYSCGAFNLGTCYSSYSPFGWTLIPLMLVGIVLIGLGIISSYRAHAQEQKPLALPAPPPLYPPMPEARLVCPSCFSIYPASIGKFCPRDATELRPGH